MANSLEQQTDVYEFGNFRVDAAKRLLLNGGGEIVPLTPKVFDTLLYLVEHAGKIIEKDELMREIWADTIVEENNLSQNISILRRVLGEKRGEHRYIATVPGKGFKFVASVEVSGFKSDVAGKLKPDETAEDSEAGRANPGTQNPEPETWNLKPETRNLKLNTENRRTNRFGTIAFAVLSVLALSSMGFYWWRENVKSAPDAPIKTIAVLPFKPLVAENRDEALEMGMADTLISRLGDNREIVVRPLSSVRKYGGLEQDALAAGRALAVDSVLDGSIQRWGDNLRVTARLVKTADDRLLWTGTFDEKFTDIFVVQDAISKRVAAALALRLSGDKTTKLEKRSTNNAEAYELYLRGRFHYLKITLPEIRKAIAYYQRAIELDPNYALAYAGMADAYRTLPIAYGTSSKEGFPQAKAAAVKALEIDENLAEAHIVLGWTAFWYEWDWQAAESELKRAIELAPNNSDARRAYAHLLSNSGRHDEALLEIKRARELDPLTLITGALEGQFLFYAGRDAEAFDRYQKTLEIEPNFWIAHNGLGRIYIRQERYPEAVAALTKAIELSGGSPEPITQLGYALAKSGNRERARATIEELKSFAAEKYIPAYNFALIYNGLGEREEALNYLEKSLQEREVQMSFIKIDTRWDDFRAESRFIELMRRMNFE
ncbi:MAG: tetratricopeptide repeat protein [Pyrinomonadaceae bacterium]|nr:tetratricopeptide repeat protein [Pyrinomonadaceae bacterium]